MLRHIVCGHVRRAAARDIKWADKLAGQSDFFSRLPAKFT